MPKWAFADTSHICTKFKYLLTSIACCCLACFCQKKPNERSQVEPDLSKLTQSVKKCSIAGYLANNLGTAASNLPEALKSN